MIFTEKELKKIKKLYDGTNVSVVKIAEKYKVSKFVILWAVDHKDYRGKHREWMRSWRKKHPAETKIINDRAQKKYLSNPETRKKINKRVREKYHKDIEKSRKYSRDMYYKNHEKRLKYYREYQYKKRHGGQTNT